MDGVSFKLEVRGLDKLINDFKKAGVDYTGLLSQAMVKATTKLKNDMQSNLTSHGTSNTGELRRSIQVREATASRGVVAVGESYGGPVEFGTKAHFPPVPAIERWAQTKLGKKGLGFIIARKIARVGTKAQPYVEPAYRSDSDFVLKQFDEATAILVERMAGK